jgi:RNA polymerase sigma factor (sigma-70 family)
VIIAPESISHEPRLRRSTRVSLPPFQAVLDSHRDAVYRFLAAALGPADADDCFQETWIAALRAYPRLRSAENLRAWVLRIAQRKMIDFHRSRRRAPLPVERVPERAVPEAEADGHDPRLWEAVRRLPPKQRTAVFCRSVLGMPYPELASVLESSEEAARRNVHEGLKRLGEEWTA